MEGMVQMDSSALTDDQHLPILASMVAASIAQFTSGNFDKQEYETHYKSKLVSLISMAQDWKPVPFIDKRKTPRPQRVSIRLCNSGHFASPQVYSAG